MIAIIDQSTDKLGLISRIYPFLRHPITSVRRAVVSVLHRFITAQDLDRTDWMMTEFFSLMFENIVLETLPDIRETSWKAFDAGLQEVHSESGEVLTIIDPDNWYSLVMTPIGKPLDPKAFVQVPKKKAGHDIDKPMMQGDVGLVDTEVMWATRIEAAKALASLRQYGLDEEDDQVEVCST